MEKRNELISFLQTFGIILVVVGHSFYGCPYKNPIFVWIYSFHMPLFMFISGYLMQYTQKRKPGVRLADVKMFSKEGFIWKKVKRLLIPYVFISSLAFLPKNLLSSFAGRPIDFTFDAWVNMLIYPSNNVIIFFWFLPTLFLLMFIVMSALKLSDKINLRISIYLILIVLCVLHFFNPLIDVRLFNLSGVVFYAIYFVLGMFYCFQQRRIDKLFVINGGYTLVTMVAISIILLQFDFVGNGLLTAINGILMSISLGYFYLRYNLCFFTHLYGASYSIYLFSWFPQVIAQQIFLKLTGAPWYIGSILAIISGMYVPYIIFRFTCYAAPRSKLGRFFVYLSGN